jgi:D-alanyl-D-alanine carboxypeptidase
MTLVVARGGDVLFSRAWGAASLDPDRSMQPGTIMRLASVTKQFTAAAVLTLVEDGALSLDTPLAQLVPELPAAREVTVRDLLVQTSGIPDYAGDDLVQAGKHRPHSPAEMLALIARLTPSLEFAPGTRWAYSNSNYVLLGIVVERASGMPFPDYLREHVLRPAGLTDIAWDRNGENVPGRALGYRKAAAPGGFEPADAIDPSIPGPAGALRGPVTGLPKWYAALHGGRVLGRGTLRQMTGPGTLGDGRTTRWGMPDAWREGLASDYAMGLFRKETPAGTLLWHSGDIDGFSSWSGYYPESRVAIAMSINSESVSLPAEAVEKAVFPAGDICLASAGD